ncbi:response regulator [Fluoribacter dumoffii]|uniref:Response regulator of citrate/malate metabolism n=1 Tax=Fluoribacter dumoffii TaxID=463 RepID=A0A377GEA7_9GAMM|nr:response regulator [Fluoribacter dumoffii]KTC91390.1 two-component response regulator [Fluoribacter dumoffii NY 23]MCW8387480.1 response regulator [Fluoribacter dumoffii]MCW8417012.1 response regulator [Fluoribacter dumoffii]MCW8455148.1 response regulator [Fluoribacter dumoffii]MCW8460775.1 response regulator [Fluoribacter dumoffii]
MRVLIIEDSAFNAFCLSRLLESVIASVSIEVVSTSQDALSFLDTQLPDLVIIDGELNLINELSTHGPQLAAVILQKYPHLPLIAWSDSEFMRSAFAKTFTQHNRLVNGFNTWAKTVTPECIKKTWAYYFDEAVNEKQQAYSHVTHAKRQVSYHLDCL